MSGSDGARCCSEPYGNMEDDLGLSRGVFTLHNYELTAELVSGETVTDEIQASTPQNAKALFRNVHGPVVEWGVDDEE